MQSQGWATVTNAIGFNQMLTKPLCSYYRMMKNRCPAWAHGAVGVAISWAAHIVFELAITAAGTAWFGNTYFELANGAQSCWQITYAAITAVYAIAHQTEDLAMPCCSPSLMVLGSLSWAGSPASGAASTRIAR